jgi:site-specific recombinase XerD
VTRLLNRGMAIQDVAVIAGHTKIDTTMKYYSQSKAHIKNSYRMHTA